MINPTSTKLSKNFKIQNKQIKIIRSSDSELKKHLYTVVKYFIKEFTYGPEYKYEHQINNKNIGYLFRDGKIVFGGCGFSKLPSISEDIWSLEWVWLHPHFRHKGKFSYYLDVFIQQYSQVALKRPISCEQQEFLNIEIQQGLESEFGYVIVKKREYNV